MMRKSVKGAIPILSAAAPNVVLLESIAPQPDELDEEEALGFDAQSYRDCPIIYNCRLQISRNMFRGAEEATTRTSYRKNLNRIKNFICDYCTKTGFSIKDPEDIDSAFTFRYFTTVMDDDRTTKRSRILFFNRFLEAIGVPSELKLIDLPDDRQQTERELYTENQVAQLVNKAKEEAQIVLQRQKLVDELGEGRDPRAKRGGWEPLENRLWAIRHILGMKPDTWGNINKTWPVLTKGLEKKEGVAEPGPDGSTVTTKGLVGHLRYFFPEGIDLAPFAILTALRTSFNFAVVGNLRAGGWFKTYPFASPIADADELCYIVAEKRRGKQTRHGKGKLVRAVSLMTPYSHAFQVLTFVEKLTEPCRIEIARRIKLLHAKKMKTVAERRMLKHLMSIKDLLFVYYARGKFNRLSPNGSSEFIRQALIRYGVPPQTRMLRDYGLAQLLTAPGGNVSLLQLLASHSKKIEAYERRKQLLQFAEDAVIKLFASSIELVRQGRFSLAALRNALMAQGFSVNQVGNLLDSDTTTRWGNRCADPSDPPRSFLDDTEPGCECEGQRCIDGCPYARWFPESIPFVEDLVQKLDVELQNLGMDVTFASSHAMRLGGLQALLASWPKETFNSFTTQKRGAK